MRTSIVIPTRNRAEMVVEAVTSVLSTQGPCRQVVVVDDGSTDHTREALSRFGNEIVVVDGGGRGKGNARNAGVRRAEGEWIAFLDDDDLFLPEGLEKLENTLAAAPAEVGVVYGRPQYIRTDPSNPLVAQLPEGHGEEGWVFPRLLAGSFMVTGTMLVRRSVVLEVGGMDPTLPYVQDYELWLRISANCRFRHVDADICRVRLHATNSTRNIEEAGRLTEQVKQRHLLSGSCTRYAAARAAEGDSGTRVALAELCLDLARRRWWEGDVTTSRRAHLQAFRLAPQLAITRLGPLWRAWVPIQRPLRTHH